MKIVLCALNSKYIHTNLAVRYIKAYADAHSKNAECVIAEDTVNGNINETAEKILAYNPDAVAFSCYIWNISHILTLCKLVKSENHDITVILGGPEVSFNPSQYAALDYVDYVQCGDGEKSMTALFDALADGSDIPKGFGICYKNVIEKPYCEKNLCDIESPYTEEYLSSVKGRIAYMESTRGCPFSCAFCLSGADKGVRYFDDEYVKNAIMTLWNSGAKTVKLIDRTFNANKAHCDMIIKFILDNHEKMPKVCFHFEIAADILADSTMELLSKAPKGLFQIEAGLQSFNHHTLEAVMRKTDTDKICENVKKLVSFGNIHTHIDLIAGLPYEDFTSFKESFNKAYSVGAHMLQLGFLKLLHGSRLRNEVENHGFVYSVEAPYEIISTNWITADEMNKLRQVEDANEKIANSGRFRRSLEYVFSVSGMTPFDLFLGFGKKESMPLDDYTALVFDYFSSFDGVDKAVLRDRMCEDRLAENKSGKLPKCLQIKDKMLAKITYQLEINPETAPIKGVKRGVCILYSENKVLYVDYIGDSDEYKMNYVRLDGFAEENNG